MTPEKIEIRELKIQVQRIELEKDILKKATVISSGQCNWFLIISLGVK